MKYLSTLVIFLIVCLSLSAYDLNKPRVDKENCTCKGIPLYGKVRVKDFGATFKVRIVNVSEDLKVEVVRVSKNTCGTWEFVRHSEDFSIEFVEVGEDFTIRMVNVSPGIP